MQFNYKLNCLVSGDEPNHIFEIKIAPTESVSALKELIKEKKKHAFRDVDADRLDIWKVVLPVDETLERNINNLELDPKKSLSPVAKLLKVFSNLPEEEHLHIVVQGPPVASGPPAVHLSLNCFVCGDEPGRIFEIKIAPTESVSALKELIKEKQKPQFDDVPANRLDLWKVDINPEKDQQRGLLCDAEKLKAVTRLSKVFTVVPEDEHLHIVVQLPPQRSHILSQLSPSEHHQRTMQLRLEYSNNFPSKPPSSQGIPSAFEKLQKQEKLAIYWNRPATAAYTIPPTLLHPIFGTFINDCENHEPTDEDNKLVMALSTAMSGFFTDETERSSKFRHILRDHGIDLTASTIDYTKYTTDGDMRCGGLLYAIAEVKNEIGSKGAEPHAQAISYYVQSSKSLAPQKGFRFPCILISLFGPYIDFSAAIWSTRPNMQSLSTVMPLCYHQTDMKMRTMVARHVGALRNALQSLKTCYDSELHTTLPSPNPDLKFLDSEFPDATFPYPYSYTCMETSSTRHFTYISQMDTTKLLFAARTMDNEKICIKFVHRYSKDVHRRCASEYFAPALYGFENLPGGWHMIVMEMIGEDYCCLGESSARYSHYDEITTKLVSLHQESLVHGDIRDTNIMVKKDGSPGILFVDFDWSGKIGEIRYPMNVYRGKRLWRPAGAKDGQLILAEHDIQMLDAMFPQHYM
ncbi:hypothetical protein M405DRAFT_778345 [Rhizopogon salebrosus TDB-379]|nr:hypothetical protein M405DRAFT_778345 [Rhizopogon salebrosus TDB-379]